MSKFIAILFITLFSACQPKESKILTEFLSANGVTDLSYKAVVIVPLEGCAPCINKTIEYAKTSVDSDVIFVIETFGSQKSLKMKFNQNQLKSNIIVDHDDALIKDGLAITYPVLYLMKQNSIEVLNISDANFNQVIRSLEDFLDAKP